MIYGLEPYPRYEPSPVLGLASIPAHWSAPRLKTVFREVDRRSGTGREPLLSLRMQQGLIDHHEAGGKLIPPASLTHYKLAAPGELVMNRMRAAAGLFGVPPKLGLVSPDYAVLHPRSPVQLDYFLNLFKTPVMMSAFRLESRGLGTGESGFLRLYTERFGMLAAPVPPPEEQAAIVRFLDHADRRIRRYIHAKQKLIKLLEEQKQAIIHQAVTRGLDPSVPMKDSPFEGYDFVPAHWRTLALKRVLRRLVDCEHKTAPMEEGTALLVVRTTAVRHGRLRLSGTYPTSEAAFAAWTRRSVPEAGDVIFTREAPAGEACVVPEGLRVCLGQRTVLMKLRRDEYDPYFLVHMIYGGPPATMIALASQGSTVGHFNMDDIANLPVYVPPLDEQESIVSELRLRLRSLEAATERAEDEIRLLRELRTRLIADVVTGQLDVRAAAAALPDEPTDDEPLDDADETSDEDLDADTSPEDDNA